MQKSQQKRDMALTGRAGWESHKATHAQQRRQRTHGKARSVVRAEREHVASRRSISNLASRSTMSTLRHSRQGSSSVGVTCCPMARCFSPPRKELTRRGAMRLTSVAGELRDNTLPLHRTVSAAGLLLTRVT